MPSTCVLSSGPLCFNQLSVQKIVSGCIFWIRRNPPRGSKLVEPERRSGSIQCIVFLMGKGNYSVFCIFEPVANVWWTLFTVNICLVSGNMANFKIVLLSIPGSLWRWHFTPLLLEPRGLGNRVAPFSGKNVLILKKETWSLLDDFRGCRLVSRIYSV